MSVLIADTYPDKVGLSESEAMHVLRSGPLPRWFHPWAEHARVAPQTPRPWGYVHIHGEWGEPPVWELVGYYSLEDLAWGLQSLFDRSHDWHVLDVDGYLNDHECHGVFYWLPSDPQLLRLPLGVTR
ncbi:hypothetical protein [Leifsonia poae]|uniref:hypothetical protein n=1 Tax=Leifsonia poae TaxID=110933 RepID=UPI001CC0B34A|nr:hypothetical protein [Leifsonia poae]